MSDHYRHGEIECIDAIARDVLGMALRPLARVCQIVARPARQFLERDAKPRYSAWREAGCVERGAGVGGG
mgnify:CR=1 FL=1